MKLEVSTTQKRQIVDITHKVEQVFTEKSGLINVFVKHTTAAITTADLDPGTDLDLLDALRNMIPDQKWRHPHNPDHAPDHLLSSIIGPSIIVPIETGELQLGTWQRIILIELDGPRMRDVEVSLISTIDDT